MKWFCLWLPLLAGCAGTTHVYQMEDVRPAGAMAGKNVAAPVLRLLATRSDSYDDQQDLAFGTPNGLRGHYRYARWSELPSQRLHELLFRRLDDSPAFSVVLDSYAPGNEQCDLETVLLDWYHDTATRPGMAVVMVRASLYGSSDQRQIGRQTFRVTAPVQQYDGAAAVKAFDVADAQLLTQLTDWTVSLAGQCRAGNGAAGITPASSLPATHARPGTAPR